ncbi:reverse transcriptase domain-containing protein [Tanacetum coccineum]
MPIVSKVSTSSSTPAVSSDVAELKDMVRALILDKKNQTQAPASSKRCRALLCNLLEGGHSLPKFPASNDYRDYIHEYVVTKPSKDVEPKQIILDPDDQPMWENAKTIAPTSNSAIIQLDVHDNFIINSTHLNMIRKNNFDGYLRADLHDHIREFLAIYNMFKYSETQSEAVKLLIFPFSLYDEAKTWFNELNEESITSWEQIRRAFINRFFPPSLFNRLLLEIRNFSQLVCENLTGSLVSDHKNASKNVMSNARSGQKVLLFKFLSRTSETHLKESVE